jgi:glycerol-3-phosphate dehydrogenase
MALNKMKREEQINRLADETITWDLAVIGGGATGLGTCLDAALRGYKVILLESADFSKGTSSRSTKLVHGGVRYLAKGDLGLVKEALYERGLLLRNASHLVRNQLFIIPVYSWWDAFVYTAGLKFYDLLAGKLSMGKSMFVHAKEAGAALPGLKTGRLKGGVLYHDGQFDDSRLALNLAQSAVDNGGCVLNYVKVTALKKNSGGKVIGVEATDLESGKSYRVKARSVINATGVFVDGILQMDQPGSKPLVKPSQGVHIVVDSKFLSGKNALMIPKTEDGRVLFAIPWHEKVIIGTTDTLVDHVEEEPKALEEEVDFILRTASQYLNPSPGREDILSVYAGLRPLAAPSDTSQATREISRRHKIMKSSSGLITVTGGKWTTYRRMAEETVDIAIKNASLPYVPCPTKDFRIQGVDCISARQANDSVSPEIAAIIAERPDLSNKLHERYNYLAAHVIWAVREEMARNVEDVLARRLRMLFLDVEASLRMAPYVARLMAGELHQDSIWEENQLKQFKILSEKYRT